MTTELSAATTAGVSRPRMTVLLSMSAPTSETRYVNQVVDGAAQEVRFLFFSWRHALFGKFDVFHVHWPEFLIRHSSAKNAFLRRMALRVFLLRSRLRRIAIVRTVHNLRPHEAGRVAEERVLRSLDRQTDLFILLNPTTELPAAAPSVLIPHGHYRDRFASFPLPATVPGTIVYFGLIRKYKGVDALLAAFRGIDDHGLRLRIVGRPSDGLDQVILRDQALDSRITSRLEFVPDSDLVAEIGAAELVVMPYREMHNSGTVLVALSLGRPVLVPRSPSNEALAAEVGPGWIHLFDGEFTSATLQHALEATRSAERPPEPALSGRDWSTIGESTYWSYIAALRSSGRFPADGRLPAAGQLPAATGGDPPAGGRS